MEHSEDTLFLSNVDKMIWHFHLMIEENTREDGTMPRYNTTLGSSPLQFNIEDLSIVVEGKPFEHPYLPQIWSILIGSTYVGDGAAIEMAAPQDPYIFTHKTSYFMVTIRVRVFQIGSICVASTFDISRDLCPFVEHAYSKESPVGVRSEACRELQERVRRWMKPGVMDDDIVSDVIAYSD